MKTILITGATDGIGLETARVLAKEGHHLLLHGRNPEKLSIIKEELSGMNGNITTFVADLSILQNSKALANEILNTIDNIDVIINNAGVYVMENPMTADGLDARFTVNTIAPYLLTKMLLPILSQNGRVINLSSAAQTNVDVQAMKNGIKIPHDSAYAQSKLAITMWTMELAEELGDKGVAISVNPRSFLGSKMVKEAYGRQGYDLGIGAKILCELSLLDEFHDKSGAYYDNDAECFANPHPFALSKANRVALVEVMDQLIAEKL